MPVRSDGKTHWVDEVLHENGGLVISYRADRIIFEESTGQQHLVIYDNQTFGRMMALDGATQVTEKDEFVYHEMMTHVPVLAHGNVKRLLIIGGGDGGILREAVRHKGIEKITMVEIDPAVTNLAKEHLPMISVGAFDDPRLDLIFTDGAEFMRTSSEQYDVIIVDSTDPVGPGVALFEEEFYRNAKACLTEGGILVTQNGVPFLQSTELSSTMAKFKRLFRYAHCYVATIPTYVGGFMAMGWGTDDEFLNAVTVETLTHRYREAGLKTRYYTPAVHKAAFALPAFIEEIVAKAAD